VISSQRTRLSQEEKRCSYEGCQNPTVSSKFTTISAHCAAGGRDWSSVVGRVLCRTCYKRFMARGQLERMGCAPNQESSRSGAQHTSTCGVEDPSGNTSNVDAGDVYCDRAEGMAQGARGCDRVATCKRKSQNRVTQIEGEAIMALGEGEAIMALGSSDEAPHAKRQRTRESQHTSLLNSWHEQCEHETPEPTTCEEPMYEPQIFEQEMSEPQTSGQQTYGVHMPELQAYEHPTPERTTCEEPMYEPQIFEEEMCEPQALEQQTSEEQLEQYGLQMSEQQTSELETSGTQTSETHPSEAQMHERQTPDTSSRDTLHTSFGPIVIEMHDELPMFADRNRFRLVRVMQALTKICSQK
jgi:hypothetical protein